MLINGNEEYQIVQSTNAHIEYDETTKSGKMVKATIGNELNLEKFSNLITTSIS